MIATPCFGGQITETYFQSMIGTYAWAQANDVSLGVYTISGESLIPRARNSLVMNFLNDYDGIFEDLFFIDADQGWTPENFKRLLEAPYDIACGVYPKKKIHWSLAQKAWLDQPENLEFVVANSVMYSSAVPDHTMLTDDGFTLCRNGATGFMRIRRQVIETMIAAYPELEYDKDPEAEPGKIAYALFDPYIEDNGVSRIYLGEDYAFCRRWQSLGGEIYSDIAGPLIQHVGTHIYGSQ